MSLSLKLNSLHDTAFKRNSLIAYSVSKTEFFFQPRWGRIILDKLMHKGAGFSLSRPVQLKVIGSSLEESFVSFNLTKELIITQQAYLDHIRLLVGLFKL